MAKAREPDEAWLHELALGLCARERTDALLEALARGAAAEMEARASAAALDAGLPLFDALGSFGPEAPVVISLEERSDVVLPKFASVYRAVARGRVVFVVEDLVGGHFDGAPRMKLRLEEEDLVASSESPDENDAFDDIDDEIVGVFLANVCAAVRAADRTLPAARVEDVAYAVARAGLAAAMRLADPPGLLLGRAPGGRNVAYAPPTGQKAWARATRATLRLGANADWSSSGLGLEVAVTARARAAATADAADDELPEAASDGVVLSLRASQRISLRPARPDAALDDGDSFSDFDDADDVVVRPFIAAIVACWAEPLPVAAAAGPDAVRQPKVERTEGAARVEGAAAARRSKRAATRRVLAWGENTRQCLGGAGALLVEPTAVLLRDVPFERVRSVACSARHTLVLTWQRRVYACGDGDDGALGLGGLQQASSLAAVDWGSAEDEDAPVIVALAAGSDVFGAHSAAVAMDGALYTWGLGVATGHRTMQAVLRPRRVQWLDGGAALPAMSAVSCGGSFCVALDPDGAAFSWGLWARGRLGLGEAPQLAQSRQAEQTDRKRLARFQLSPRAIGSAGDASNPKRRYRQVACGEAHCVALTLEGEVYAWGCNDQGQLGVGTTRSRLLEDEATPARVTFSDAGASIESVACGATHSVALDALGGAWSWGGGGGAMLGLGDRPRGGALATTNELMTQRVLEARRKSQRAAGAAPSRATARDVAFAAPRRIRGFGDGPASTKFVAVSCGERHTAFVSDARALLLCGDGVAMLGEAAVGGDAPVGDGDARQMPPEAAVIDSASVAVPRQPNARWLRRLRTARLDAVVCAGQHTVVLASGERAAAELGRKLLDNARRASRLLAASGFEDDEARPKQDSDDETDGEFDAEATPRAFGVDCMVVPGGGLPAYAHLSVLSARSSTFAELILLERRDDGGGAPGDVLQLLAPDLSPAALQHLLEFVYCDDVFEPTHGALHPTVLGELRRAADAYALPRLASICDDLLGTKLLDSLKVGAVSEGEEVESCFNDDFFSMVGDGSTADVTMLAGGGSVQVHKCVLEARSDFFRAMFKSGMREAGDDGVSAPMRAEVAVPDSAEGVARLMRLVYADDVEDGTVAQLLDDVAAADRYGLAPQKAACEATLLSALVGSPAAVPHALLVTSRFHASAAFDDVLAYAAGDLSKIDIAQLHAEPDVLAALLAALQRARPAALRPAAAPPAHAPEVEAAPLYDSSQTLSLPHALALLAAAAVLVLFQSRYRFRPVIVSGLNGVFIILVVVLFVHSSRLNETKRLQQTRARGVHLKSPAA